MIKSIYAMDPSGRLVRVDYVPFDEDAFARHYRIKTKDGIIDPYEYWTGQKAPATEDVECVIVKPKEQLLLPPHIEPEP